ncbi:hypothetical protein Tco_1174896 [Tanacetum coccineum]
MDTSEEIAASKDTSKVDSSSFQIADVVTGGSVKNKTVGHKLKLNLKAAKEATKKTVDLKPNPKTHVKPKSKEMSNDNDLINLYPTLLYVREIPKEAGVRHENFKVAPHPNFPDHEVAIGGTLSAKRQTELCSLLKENLDIFAWHPSDMTGVPRSIAEHRLNIQEGYSPIRQKKKGQAQSVRKPSKRKYRN